MEVWIPLLSACVGGLIATIPLLFGLIVQIVLHVSENRRKDRDAKTQLELELMRNDIKILEESIDNDIKAVHILLEVFFRRITGQLSDMEMRNELISVDGKYVRLRETSDIANKVAYSLGEEFHAEYRKFTNLISEIDNECTIPNPSTSSLEEIREWVHKAVQNAGKLHNMLRDRLISIREKA